MGWWSSAFLSLLILVPFPAPAASDEAQAHFRRAQEAFRAGKYAEARRHLGALLRLSDTGGLLPKARLLGARLEEDFARSLDRFRDLAREYAGKPEGEEALKALADRLLLADRFQEARDAYGEFLAKYPESPQAAEARLALGAAELALGRPEAAEAAYRKVLEGKPKGDLEARARTGLGRALLRRGEPGSAEKVLLPVLDRHPRWGEIPQVYALLAESYEKSGEAARAHAAWLTLLERYPEALEAGDARARLAILEAENPDLKKIREERGRELKDSGGPEGILVDPGVPTPTPAPAPQGPDAVSFHVQVGVFTDPRNARALEDRLREAGYEPFTVEAKSGDAFRPYFKVRIPGGGTREEAEAVAVKVTEEMKVPSFVVGKE